jgi:hypothetical protein
MRCPRPVENLNRAWSLFCAQRGCEFTLATLLQNSARPAASRGEASVVIVSAHGLPACPVRSKAARVSSLARMTVRCHAQCKSRSRCGEEHRDAWLREP